MPTKRKLRSFTPLLIEAEKRSVKNGVHHAVFTSRFDKYVGDWKNDLKDGKGAFVTVSGKLYEGDWYKGFRHGFGVLSNKLPDNTYKLEYRGEWVRGKPEGVGWRYYGNEDVYFGFWKSGQKHGYGKMWYSDNTFYTGYWNKDQREGLGMFVEVNGNWYEGHWEKNLKSGFGRYYHMHTGQLQEGCWVENICVKSMMLDIDVRQYCDRPTQYPIPMEQLQDSRLILEKSEFWVKQKIGRIDKKLQTCIDKMNST
ncbi:MORN repeat-containing protein 3 [Bombyx mandarina]|uniref:MORN repeat-containing protein 3 n=2 Tax=Bombyx TaxID=7090 RepID=A0A8R2AK33_BOMMO|nr:MORN repeat-containing protein 3 [Bombyx mori]XP_028038072.1 MORN repeat-containing protein 3 [Bombyx mandarina]